jgi:hypothetical protein
MVKELDVTRSKLDAYRFPKAVRRVEDTTHGFSLVEYVDLTDFRASGSNPIPARPQYDRGREEIA